MSKRRNPSKKSNALGLILLGIGAYSLLRPNSAPAPVQGIGSFFSKVTKSIKNVAKKAPGGGPLNVIKKSVKVTAKVLDSTPVGKLIKKAPLLNKLDPNKKAPPKAKAVPTATGTQIIYQDANGNTITKAQYDALMAQWQTPPIIAPYQTPVVSPQVQQVQQAYPTGPSTSGQSFSADQVPLNYGPTSSGPSGGGGSASDYYGDPAAQGAPSLLPTAASTPDPTTADAADAAPPAKVNPLMIAGAFIAAPIVMGLIGKKH